MTENIKCPCCNNSDEYSDGNGPACWYACMQCYCEWNESKRQPPNAVPAGDKAECLNLYEEAVDLIDSLNSEQRIDYSDYSLLRDAVDAIGNCIEENIQPPNAWIACSERLPKYGVKVAAIHNEFYRIIAEHQLTDMLFLIVVEMTLIGQQALTAGGV